ncbi:GspE/PulE family protein [Patescibacteria group bacterium]|nr:GspE/PulE family protein [Patescibacteria group bacterium]
MDIKELLIENNYLTPQQYEALEQKAKQISSSIDELLISQNIITEDQLGALIEKKYSIPFINLSNVAINPEIIKIIPEKTSLTKKIVAFEKTVSTLKIGMVNPRDINTIEFIKKGTGYNIDPYYITEKSFYEALKFYKTSIKEELKDLIEKTTKDVKNIGENDTEALPIIKITDKIFEYANTMGASDIHIEPQEKDAIIRYRIDGILHDQATLSTHIYQAVIARIKILANLKIDEHRLPQDGRFKTKINDLDISFRVSIMPVYYGEVVVARLLESSAKEYSLDVLGFTDRDLSVVSDSIKKTVGMILVTGPTGSGKSTTLYTMLSLVNNPEVNIDTIEDPIEYSMTRINQTQIAPQIGLTFASGLRAFLRQDPDILMVGEIRDNETADIAVNAAMTGHLVLSTLHTNNAIGAIPRLLDMGVEPFLVSSTLNLIIAQRLVRKLCNSCKEKYTLDKKLLAVLKSQMTKMGISINFDVKNLFKAKGCQYCSNGYKGRIGIYEVIEVDDIIKGMISRNENINEIEKIAKKNGMTLMMEDGIKKAMNGITSIEEVLRVTKE